MKILLATSEAAPYIKTGGLGDVAGSLPKALAAKGHEVKVFCPLYSAIKPDWREKFTYLKNAYVRLGWRNQYCGVFHYEMDGVDYYFIDNEYYFSGPKPYGDICYDLEKFAFFSRAALSILPVIDFRPDIIHCHDWQTGLIPVYLKDCFSQGEFYRGIKSIMTIHNLKFQGVWDVKTMKDIAGLADSYFTIDKLRQGKDGNYLKGGIVYADYVTTVSNTYAEEIKTSFYGEGLDGLMNARSNCLRGIVNGIDYDEYNPETDPFIEKHYNVDTFRKEKLKNKKLLQQELGLEVNEKKFMLGLVSRLTDQKGLDLINFVMDQICGDENAQFVILGTGEERYENMFRHYAWKYGGRVSANIYYSEAMSHKIYAACDAFLMPSLFEPCGLSQLMSLRYGTVPIVRETGGLKDTVEPYNEFEGKGTGFSFANYNAHEMLGTINYAKKVFFENKREWNKIVDRGMTKDFSWSTSAREYENLYRQMLGW